MKGGEEGVTVSIDDFLRGFDTKGKQKNEEVAGGDVGSSEVSMVSEYKYSVLTVLWEYIRNLPAVNIRMEFRGRSRS